MIDDDSRVAGLLDALLTRQTPESLRSRLARTREGTYPTTLDVEDGYPSEERVEEIRMVAAVDARRWLHDEFPFLWGSLPCGSVEVREAKDIVDRPARRIRVATGGWSGCEDVIYAVLGHFMMATYCKERHSGGAYVFVVPHEERKDA